MCPNSICTVALHTPFGKYNSTVNGCRAERVKRKMKKSFVKASSALFKNSHTDTRRRPQPSF